MKFEQWMELHNIPSIEHPKQKLLMWMDFDNGERSARVVGDTVHMTVSHYKVGRSSIETIELSLSLDTYRTLPGSERVIFTIDSGKFGHCSTSGGSTLEPDGTVKSPLGKRIDGEQYLKQSGRLSQW